eukprot:CAMPEP_0194339934 /NCGR_PEP_ID=MMETSP0171-20130528/84842_1 /TAXON_ID=218684 /ORGANISM="Corethron pennatum, Strain L29A3" /LENGTH=493 /DNA_ID=CAMNT_0039104707 /DNA_START=363 /DNA_END=1841 /DNA_ORIENTATION=-
MMVREQRQGPQARGNEDWTEETDTDPNERHGDDDLWQKEWFRKFGDGADASDGEWVELLQVVGGRARSLFFERRSGASALDVPPADARRVRFLTTARRAQYLRRAAQIAARHRADGMSLRFRLAVLEAREKDGREGVPQHKEERLADDPGAEEEKWASQGKRIFGTMLETRIHSGESAGSSGGETEDSFDEVRGAEYICHPDNGKAEADGSSNERDMDEGSNEGDKEEETDVYQNPVPVTFASESTGGERMQDLEQRESSFPPQHKEEKLTDDPGGEEEKGASQGKRIFEAMLETILERENDARRRSNPETPAATPAAAEAVRPFQTHPVLAGPETSSFEGGGRGEQCEERVHEREEDAAVPVKPEYYGFPTASDGPMEDNNFPVEMDAEEVALATSAAMSFQKNFLAGLMDRFEKNTAEMMKAAEEKMASRGQEASEALVAQLEQENAALRRLATEKAATARDEEVARALAWEANAERHGAEHRTGAEGAGG